MAQSFLAPTATCSLTATSAANVKGYVWFGLVAPDDAIASAAFYTGSTAGGDHLWSLAASMATAIGPVGPFMTSDCSIYVVLSGTNASALVATASY